jgi:hypothetical protein
MLPKDPHEIDPVDIEQLFDGIHICTLLPCRAIRKLVIVVSAGDLPQAQHRARSVSAYLRRTIEVYTEDGLNEMVDRACLDFERAGLTHELCVRLVGAGLFLASEVLAIDSGLLVSALDLEPGDTVDIKRCLVKWIAD